MSRRGVLGLMLGGVGCGMLSPLRNLAQASTSTLDQYLVVVNAVGGLRSPDFCDAYDRDAGYVDTQYDFGDAHGVTSDWSLPPNAAGIYDSPAGNDHSSRMAVVRHVYTESANHDVGQQIGLTGLTRSTAPGGAVVVANEASFTSAYAVGGFSFARSVPSGALTSLVAGEPSDLVDLLEKTDFTGTASLDTLLRDEIESHNQSFAGAVRAKSPVIAWRDAVTLGWNIEDAALSNLLDPGSASTSGDIAHDFATAGGGSYNATYAARFGAAYQCIANDVSPVISIDLNGFDTHAEKQDSGCVELSTMLGVLMDKLDAAGKMGKTTILVTSDFDRTLQYNSSGGSDHYTYGSVALFGHGISAGSAVGSRGNYPGESGAQYTRKDIWATVFQIFGVDHHDYFTDAQVITDLLA